MSKLNKQSILSIVAAEQCRSDIPVFRPGDTIRVHSRIIEGSKERVQMFEGVVTKCHGKPSFPSASFTVRKVSYNIGVERTFMLHSPRIEKIEVVRKGHVRKARLFYLRPLRGKGARIRSEIILEEGGQNTAPAAPAKKAEEPAPTETAPEGESATA